MTIHGNSNIPVDLLGILSCITDGVRVYRKHHVLFANVEGHLILEQTQKTLLNGLQFDEQAQSFHQFEIEITERKRTLDCILFADTMGR